MSNVSNKKLLKKFITLLIGSFSSRVITSCSGWSLISSFMTPSTSLVWKISPLAWSQSYSSDGIFGHSLPVADCKNTFREGSGVKTSLLSVNDKRL